MVRRGLVRSRHEARQLIEAGRVKMGGRSGLRPSTMVGADEVVEITSGSRFASRGGWKLEAALDHFGVVVAGKRVLDVGAGAGGFTDCLLSRGAEAVTAIDVGTGQFDRILAPDPRLEVLEQTDIRTFSGGSYPLVVVDLSFISICSVASSLGAVVEPGGDLIALVKPQFEVGRQLIARGIVNDPGRRRSAIRSATDCLSDVGLDTVGEFASPLKGEHGNQETFLWGQKRE